MGDWRQQNAGESLLRAIAKRAIDLARTGNKAGILRLRYLARQVYEIMPFGRHPRLMDLTGAAPASAAKRRVQRTRH